MGKNIYEVFLKDTTNEFIMGRISGIIESICSNGDRLFAIESTDDRSIAVYRFETSWWRYRRIKSILEYCYPKKCVFIK